MAKSSSNGGRGKGLFRGDRGRTIKRMYDDLSADEQREFRDGLDPEEQKSLDEALKENPS